MALIIERKINYGMIYMKKYYAIINPCKYCNFMKTCLLSIM